MSEAIVDPDVQPGPAPAADEPSAQPVAQAQSPAQAQEEEDPTAGLDGAEEKLQALHHALTSARGQLRELKPLAQKAHQLEQQVNEFRPYVEFLRNNQQLLQPQQASAALSPQDDPALVDYARTLDLYTQDGKPDTSRAAKLREMTRTEAQAIAQQAIAPVQEATHEQRAAQNLQWIVGQKDADGRQLEEQYIAQTVGAIYQGMAPADAKRVLADPKVAQLIAYTALGLQAAAKPVGQRPQAPTQPPLHVETAGGGHEVALSDSSKRFAKMTGRTEKDWQESAKRFKPNQSNPLE